MKLEHLFEKWKKDYETPESEKGKYKDKSLEELRKMKKSASGDKLKEINFAIRAKKASGGKWKGVSAD